MNDEQRGENTQSGDNPGSGNKLAPENKKELRDREETGATAMLRGGKARLVQRRTVRRPSFDRRARARFIAVLAATCNVRLASRTAGIHHNVAYLSRRQDPGFAADWSEALASGYARLEVEALRYALERLPGGVDPHAEQDGDRDARRGGDDGDGPVRATVAGSPVTALVERRASDADLRFVLAILGRYTRAGKNGGTIRVAVPSEAETDARLTALLDKLERQVAR